MSSAAGAPAKSASPERAVVARRLPPSRSRDETVLFCAMKSRLPPLRAVEIFVVAGRALSFTAAAKNVNLTPSAVSRRMRDLERELGTTLFRRFNRRLELTADGARFLDAASRAIELIERESDANRPRATGPRCRDRDLGRAG